MNWNMDDLPVFVAVVEQRGVTAAARALSMPKSTVSAALSRLEQGLGLRLVERNPRGLRLTSEGETFFRRAQLILDEAREADAAMAGLSAVPRGRLAVALPPAFAQEMVAPRLAAFRARHPEIELELVVTGHGLELLRDRVDLAVVVGPLEDSELISRRLLGGRLIWVASPAYAAAHEIGPELDAVARHVQILETRYAQARLPVHVAGQARRIDLSRGVTQVNDPLVVRRAVLAGAGITLLPERYCRDQLAEGSLVELCRDVRVDRAAAMLSVVYASRRHLSPRLRAFLDFLTESVAPAA
ncbi:LysR family transcriptional regulator [Sinisalibacter aestuarii]|uniref:Transcriptional regulator n=1 Tax=Sinisalibacter aestuarii TaxID=2949426 RepID=A0ABQ5LUJ1_9RHOB|nr:LysR family transcriptional regulator [Sinisalibacter aestuarii]GKY88026.1 transcriptional regulator [Sinisalibacter aestuarii]